MAADFLGRYQQGQEVPLWGLCLGASNTPTLPDAAPVADVYSESGLVAHKALPVQEPPATTGLFQGSLYLDENYPTGHYCVEVSWLISGTRRATLSTFEVVDGGAATGQVLAMTYYHTPQSEYYVQQRTSGRVFKGKNPHVA